MNPNEILLDDLAKYSGWPKRLLTLEKFDVKHKTEKAVLREFEADKWGRLLQHARRLNRPTLDDVEQLEGDAFTLAPYFEAGKFYLDSLRHIEERHIDLYAEVLAPHLAGASCLVELGAGYGAKLIRLAQRREFAKIPLIAGEYTESGRELISLISSSINMAINVGYCDFRKMVVDTISIPEDAIIFTSYAAHYVPEISNDFVRFLSKFKPKIVVHFEPCYEYYSFESLHGMMCRRYIELNDYTRNLVSVIELGRKQDGLVVKVKRNVLGSNPFLPVSVIEWTPKSV